MLRGAKRKTLGALNGIKPSIRGTDRKHLLLLIGNDASPKAA